jgi:predicted RND superfamily exporter protein
MKFLNIKKISLHKIMQRRFFILKKKYIILVVIFVLIFFSFYYKKIFNGNNIIKQSEEKIVDNILNDTLNYKAQIRVKIYSNKNENTYNINEEENEEYSCLEVTGDSDISGLRIETDKNKTTIQNTNLKLEKIYENYKPLLNNCLFLSSFSREYREAVTKEQFEENGKIVIKIKLNKSTKYIKYKELYLDKETGLPQKLIVKSSDKQIVACIEYINIEIL